MLKKFFPMLVATLLAALPSVAHAQFVHNGNLDVARQYYEQFAVANGGHSIGLAYNFPNGTPFVASGGLLGNFWDEQDQRFYTWGASVAHNFKQGSQFSTNHRILTGTNFMSSPGEEYQIAEYFLHPDYVNIGGNSPDVALFRLDVALNISNIDVAPTFVGDRLTYAGFGRPGTPATGLLPHDGFGRAFDVSVHDFGLSGGSISDFYARSIFWPSGEPGFLPLGGLGTSGTSGAFGYNEFGQLSTLAALATSGTPSYFDSTYGVHISDPYIWNWWNATLPPAVPAPGAIALFGIAGFLGAMRRRAS